MADKGTHQCCLFNVMHVNESVVCTGRYVRLRSSRMWAELDVVDRKEVVAEGMGKLKFKGFIVSIHSKELELAFYV